MGGEFGKRAEMAERFERHVAEVKVHVPEDRLVVFEVKDGWAPLCAFLGHRRTSDSRQWTPGCARYAARRSCSRGPAPRPTGAPCRRLSTPTRPI
ncbi:sulfotransferase [Actinomadura sp. NPDC048955]|uniref:sulfotransferase n=1 Tax=Actinomadura sp. NPDC048955 TaxID=3158228 RepID=UPI0033F3A56F